MDCLSLAWRLPFTPSGSSPSSLSSALSPRTASDKVFRESYRFVWEKFDPRKWWFILVQMVYGLSLNIIPAVLRKGPSQLTLGIFLTCIYILVVGHDRPWKFH